MRNYKRLLDRRSKQERNLFILHKGKEAEKTYHAGYGLGYMAGQVDILEDAVDDIEELKAKIAELESTIVDMSELCLTVGEANNMEADAIDAVLDNCAWYHNREYIKIDELVEYADKLRRGE